MAKIITVSRQFGSGGRELGKRLSDLLGWDYYDREIIQTLSEEQGLDPEYVHKALSGHGWHQYQLTYRNSFRQLAGANWRNTEVLLKQREIIREIAEEGSDCIIVGRDADVILHEEHPFRIYVCADIRNRLERCMRFEEKKEPEQEPEKEGIAFLKEYRAHSEKYLPLARHQYGCFEEQEGDFDVNAALDAAEAIILSGQ